MQNGLHIIQLFLKERERREEKELPHVKQYRTHHTYTPVVWKFRRFFHEISALYIYVVYISALYIYVVYCCLSSLSVGHKKKAGTEMIYF